MGISEMPQNHWLSLVVTGKTALVCFVIARHEQDMLEKMVIISLDPICGKCLQIQHTDLVVSIVFLKHISRVCFFSFCVIFCFLIYICHMFLFKFLYFSFLTERGSLQPRLPLNLLCSQQPKMTLTPGSSLPPTPKSHFCLPGLHRTLLLYLYQNQRQTHPVNVCLLL